MNRPTIVTMHRIRGRIRFKLSHPLRDPDKTKAFLLEYDGVSDFAYNPVTRSVIIRYEAQKRDFQEVANRLAIPYSKQYDMLPINIFTNTENKATPLAYYSIASIALAGLLKWFKIGQNTEVENTLNWIVLGTTGGAIIEHAYNELKEKGLVDPELASSMYFINSIKNKKYISGALLTWIAIFGRHIVSTTYRGVTVKVREFENLNTGETEYELDVKKGMNLKEDERANFLVHIKDMISKLFEKDQFRVAQGVFMGSSAIKGGGMSAGVSGMCKKMCL